MPSWFKIATWLLLFSLVTFSFKKPTFFWQNTNINDISLLLSFVCFAIAYYKKQVLYALPSKIWTAFLIGFGSVVLATGISILFKNILAPHALREFMRIIACSIIFGEVYLIGLQDHSFYRKALFAFVIPSFLLPFIFYSPHAILSFFLDESQIRFDGFLFDPNYYASIQILPTILLFWFGSQSKRIGYQLFFFVLFAYSVGSILWTSSRGGVIGLIAALGILAFFIFWKEPRKRSAFLIGTMIGLSILSYLLLPQLAHKNISARVKDLSTTTEPSTAITTSHPVLQKTAARISAQQGRLPIWKNALKKIAANPLGYGADYGNTVDIQGSNNDHHRVAHNTILQIFLTGGIILFIIICIGFFNLTKKVLAYSKIAEVYYLFAALVGIGVAGVFLDSLWSRWIWAIAALILVLIKKKDYVTLENN